MKRTNESGSCGKILTGFGTVLSIATLSVSLGAAGCKSTPSAADAFVQQQNQTGADPAAANMAPVNDSVSQSSQSSSASSSQQSGQVLGIRSESQSYQQGESYQNGPAPIVRQAPSGGYAQDDSQDYDNGDYQTDVDQGQTALEADQAPPPLPVYTQPEAPEPDDLWTPGYWDYAPSGGYYWVPGAWVAAPYSGALWTPGYWGYYGHRYRFHRGYWGLHIGFYGGVPYGFGYTGIGYEGGYWNNNHFFYNRAVNRINVNTFHNVYVRNVTINNYNNRVSYNGGPGGLNVRPRPAEIAALRENHTPPMQAQIQHARQAQGDRQQFFNQNHGRPAQAVIARNLPADRGIQAPAARGGFGGGQRPNEVPGAARGGFGQRPNETPGANPGAARGGFGQQPNAGQMQHPVQQQPNQRFEPNQQQRPGQPQPNQRLEPNQQQHPGQPQPNQQQFHQQPQQQTRPAEPARPVQPNPQVQQQHLQQQQVQQQQRNQQVQQQHVQQQQQMQRQQEVQRAPQPQRQPEARPQQQPQQARPQPEQRAPQPQQARPQPQAQPHPQPQAQPHPQPQPHEEHEGHH